MPNSFPSLSVTPDPAPARRETPQHVLASFPTYAGAERLVDKLADSGFPVEHTRIVGNGLRTVEHVTGRLISGRAALAGLASGAWVGLLIGLLLSLFSSARTSVGDVLGCVVFGAAWWTVFAYLAHRGLRGRRDFSSVKGLEAEQYQVQVDADRADAAVRAGGLF